MLRVCVLGPLTLRRDDGDPVPSTTRRARLLLARLATSSEPLPRERLAATIWPDVPDTLARTNLRGAVAELRRSIGSDDVVATRQTISLSHDRVRVDLAEFRAAVATERWTLAADLAGSEVLLADLDEEWVDELRADHAREVSQVRARNRADWAAAVTVPQAVRDASAELVGRDDLLRRLLDDHGRRTRVVVLGGEAGIGKTSAALAAARQAGEPGGTGAAVIFERCDEEGVLPYAPWVEAIDTLLGGLAADERRAAIDEVGAEVIRLLPRWVDESPPEVEEGGDAEPDSRRWRLFEAIASMIDQLTRSRPLLVVLDDVQWADRSSLLVLRHVLRARHPSPRRLMVIMTLRDDELSRDAPVHAFLAGLSREQVVERIRLPGLAEHDVAEMITRCRAGRAYDPSLVHALHRETEGNPFFVAEILRSTPELTATTETPFTIPDTVIDVVRRRLSSLDVGVRRLLASASVMGRDFDLGVLATAVDVAPESVVADLDVAVAAMIIDELGVGRYSFTHALIRSALHDELSLTRRALLHRRIAAALLQHRERGAAVAAGAIAHHLLLAADPALAEQAVDELRDAADEAAAQLAHAEAARYLERAVEVLAGQQTGHPPPADLLLELADAHVRAGDIDAGRRRYAQVAAVARQVDSPVVLTHAALGFAGPSWRTFGTVDGEGITLLEEALAALPGADSLLRARVQCRLAIALSFAGQPARVHELTAAATAIAYRAADPRLIAAAIEARLWSSWHPDGVETRLTAAETLLDGALAAGLEETAVMARRWRVVALLELGRMAELWSEVHQHAEDARRLKLPYELMYVAVFATMRAFLEGRFSDAATSVADVAAFSELRGGADATQFGGVHQLVLAQVAGRLADLVPGLELLVAAYPDLPGWRSALACAHLVAADPAAARAQVDVLWPPRERLPADPVRLPALCFLGFAVAGLYDVERAAELYQLLLDYDRRPVVLGAGGAVWGTTSAALAALAGLLGDDAAVVRHLDDLQTDAAQLGAPGFPALLAATAAPSS